MNTKNCLNASLMQGCTSKTKNHRGPVFALTCFISAWLATIPNSLHAALPFTKGNLVVLQAAASANNTTCSIFELDPSSANQASPVNSISIDGATTPNELRFSGSAPSTGYIADSDDGTLLAFTGANSTNSTSNVNSLNPRGVGTLDNAGTFNLATIYTGGSGNQTRCATTLDDTTWFIGDQGGFYSNGSAGASPSGNIRSVKSFGRIVYAFTASASAPPVGIISAATGGSYTALSGLTNGAGSRQDFYMVSSAGNGTYDILYVLDAASATAGTIFKYSMVSGSWTNNGSYSTSFGGFGLCAATNENGIALYVTTGTGATTANSVISLTDTAGFNSTISINTPDNVTLFTGAAGTIMKGIAFAPVTGAAAPIVTASAATSIGTTNATLNGDVSADGGSAITDRGFVYALNGGVTINDDPTFVPGTTGAFTLDLSDLDVNVEYFFKAYAVNSAGTTLSSEHNFWTLANAPNAPTVANPTPTSLDVTIDLNDGNPSGTAYAIEETTSGNFVQTDGSLGSSPVFQTAATWNPSGASQTVGGLLPGTLYTFAVEAENGADQMTVFGPGSSGSTSAASSPSITVNPTGLAFPPTAVGGSSDSQPYTVSGQNLVGNILITAPANFEVSTDRVSFSTSLTLTPGAGNVPSTTVYVRFSPTGITYYSDNITHGSSGANSPVVAVSGYGADAPYVSTEAATSVTTTNAVLNGSVVSSNNAVLTDRGFYWKDSPGVTSSDNQLSEGGTTVDSFNKVLADLGPNTSCYFRAYAANVIGATLGSYEASFYTLANTPVAPVVTNPTTNSLTVAIGSGDGNPAITTYAIQETNSSQYVQSGGILGATAFYQTAAGWGAETVTGLNLGTLYSFRVKAENDEGADTGFGPATSSLTANNPFTPGDLAVYRIGDGSAALSSAATSVFVDELTTNGAPVQNVPLPGFGVNAFGNSGSASSEGSLSLSPDGQWLCFAGYNSAAGLASVASSSAPRGVGTLDRTADYTLVATTTTQYSGNNIRSAITDGTENFWSAGQNSSGNGTYYFGLTAAPGNVQTNISNTRVVGIFNGNLYLSTGSGTKGIYQFSGLPTTNSEATLVISDASPYGFAINPSGTTAYVADDTASASGGILRYDYSGGAWGLTYTLGTGVTNIGARGLTVDWTGPNPVIYSTTAESSSNRLITITDTGSSSTATTLATASTNTIFRGVAFTPKYTQTIAPIAATATNTYGDPAYSMATTASSGLALSYSSDNPSVATVDANGTVTIVGVGTAHLEVSQAGNQIYGAAQTVSRTVFVNPLPVVLAGSRVYDGTTAADFSILTVANIVGTDDVIVASGGGTLVSGNGGSQAIASFDTLALGGAKAGDYTLTGAVGSVRINPAPGVFAFVTVSNTPASFDASKLVSVASDAGVTLAVTAVSSSSAHGGTVALVGTTITYAPAPNYLGADSFTYTLSDNLGDSAIGTVSVEVNATYASSSITSFVVNHDGSATIIASGLAGQTYEVQAADSLGGTWTTLGMVMAAPGGGVSFTDPDAPNHPNRFYRLTQ